MFEKGDYVRVKDNIHGRSGNTNWNNEMEKFYGNKYYIRDVFSYSHEYTLEDCLEPGRDINAIEDSEYWLFAEDWLELAEPEPLSLSEDDLMNMF